MKRWPSADVPTDVDTGHVARVTRGLDWCARLIRYLWRCSS
jgi:hypothetical protein